MKDYRGTDRFISERIRKRVTVLLAFFVVLSTSYAMIRPGETIRIVGDLVNEREEKAIVICKAQIYTESGLAMEEETATAIR